PRGARERGSECSHRHATAEAACRIAERQSTDAGSAPREPDWAQAVLAPRFGRNLSTTTDGRAGRPASPLQDSDRLKSQRGKTPRGTALSSRSTIDPGKAGGLVPRNDATDARRAVSAPVARIRRSGPS